MVLVLRGVALREMLLVPNSPYTRVEAATMRRLYWLDSLYACGGLIVDESEQVIDCAPIWRRWLIGKTIARIKFQHPTWRIMEGRRFK